MDDGQLEILEEYSCDECRKAAIHYYENGRITQAAAEIAWCPSRRNISTEEAKALFIPYNIPK